MFALIQISWLVKSRRFNLEKLIEVNDSVLEELLEEDPHQLTRDLAI